MKKKTIIAYLLSFAIICQGFGNGLPNVGILAFSKINNNLDEQIQKKLEGLIVDVFDKSCRFNLISVSHIFIVDGELTRQKGEEYINSEIVRQGERLVAKYIAYGYITSFTVTPKTENNKNVNQTNIEYAVNYIEVRTGKLVQTQRFKGNSTETNEMEAANSAIQGTEAILEQWLEKVFVFEGQILKIELKDNQYKIIAEVQKKCSLDPNHLFIIYKEPLGSSFVSHILGEVIVEKPTETYTSCFVTLKNYNRFAQKANITKPLDALWKENNQNVVISDKE